MNLFDNIMNLREYNPDMEKNKSNSKYKLKCHKWISDFELILI